MNDETCFVAYLREQVHNQKALLADAIENGDRKGRWAAQGGLDVAENILRVHLANGTNW